MYKYELSNLKNSPHYYKKACDCVEIQLHALYFLYTMSLYFLCHLPIFSEVDGSALDGNLIRGIWGLTTWKKKHNLLNL